MHAVGHGGNRQDHPRPGRRCSRGESVRPAKAAANAQPNINPDILKKMTAAMPDKAPATPAKPRKLLVFSHRRGTSGYHHDSIPVAVKALQLMGEKTGAFEVVASDDLSAFEADNLKQFDAVMMNNTTGEIFGQPKQAKGQALLKNLIDFVAGGKGICGIHSATDWAGYDDYGKMMGAQFKEHLLEGSSSRTRTRTTRSARPLAAKASPSTTRFTSSRRAMTARTSTSS